jgi:hypothetical protein
MEILSFENSAQPARKKKSLGLILGVALVAGVMTVGSTLAASVTIGSTPITFGQGVTQAVACDSEITVTPTTSFDNATGAGSFLLKTITISGLNNDTTNSTTGVGCGGKSLVVKAYGDSNDTALTLYTGSTGITASVNSTIGATLASPVGVTVSSAGANSLTLSIDTPTLNAADIFKITVEQQNA